MMVVKELIQDTGLMERFTSWFRTLLIPSSKEADGIQPNSFWSFEES